MFHGSPGHRPMSMTEYIEWQALLTIVEPAEAEERAAAMKHGRR